MKKAIIFDIETRDLFDNKKTRPENLEISLVGVYSCNDNKYHSFTVEELPVLWDMLKEIDTLIGFNNDHFDTPLLNKYAPFDLFTYKSIDILSTVRAALGRRLRLDWIAEGTLGIKKSGEGTKAVEWWKQGEIDKIRQYCLDDVKITKQIFEKARDTSELSYMDLGVVNTFAIDTSSWKFDDGKECVVGSLF